MLFFCLVLCYNEGGDIMKKIAILSLHLGYGGIEKCVTSLANVLCEKYEVEIAVSYHLYEQSAFSLNPLVKVTYLNDTIKPNHEALRKALESKNIFRILKQTFVATRVLYYRKKTMVKYIKNTDADVIISTRDIFNFWTGRYAKDNTLKIGWEHNHFHENYRYARKIQNSAKKLNYLVLVSKDLENFYSKELSSTSCQCIRIPNFIESFPDNSSSLKAKHLISVGRLSEEKGYLDLLTMYQKLSLQYPDWTLDIVGDGPEKEHLEKFIRENHLEKKVILHGFQKKEVIDELLHNSSIYLMSSYTESFGIVLIEAMSHGLPCIAYDSAEGAREIITNHKNGFLIKNRNEEEMIKKIEELIEDEKLRIKMGKEARESISEYTQEVVKEKWYSLIEGDDYNE